MDDVGREIFGIEARLSATCQRCPMCIRPFAKRGQDADTGDENIIATHRC